MRTEVVECRLSVVLPQVFLCQLPPSIRSRMPSAGRSGQGCLLSIAHEKDSSERKSLLHRKIRSIRKMGFVQTPHQTKPCASLHHARKGGARGGRRTFCRWHAGRSASGSRVWVHTCAKRPCHVGRVLSGAIAVRAALHRGRNAQVPTSTRTGARQVTVSRRVWHLLATVHAGGSRGVWSVWAARCR